MKSAKAENREHLLESLKEASDLFRICSKKLKILSTISWGGELAEEFFKKKESVLPKPTYKVDIDGLSDLIKQLQALAPKLQGQHPVLQWLDETRKSFILAARLLLNIGTDSFYDISSQMYGNPRSKIFRGNVTNLELATSISARLSECSVNDIAESGVKRDALEFAAEVEKRIKARVPPIPVKVDLTDDISAKVVAGMNRVRIRKDARFSDLEILALMNHEIESHCLTANNGILQTNCDFLGSGGPRTTMTQEGLAVFFEMYGHSMSQRRFLALCDRVTAIHMVEEGANFIELYRWYKERADSPMEAFYSASRMFRGSKVEGKAPFTKDGVYLTGLFGVFSFLRLAVKNQNRLLVESLVNGRIALEDVGTIAWLRIHGFLDPPKYIPRWLENWESLVSFFSFSAIVNSIDLSPFQHYFDASTSLYDWDFSV